MTQASALELSALPQTLAICRLEPQTAIPTWAQAGAFFSITRTPDELSLVCDEAFVPPEARAERGWRALKVHGPLDFGLTGVLASLTVPLAAKQISLFSVSTF